jgi:hypothetical protein
MGRRAEIRDLASGHGMKGTKANFVSKETSPGIVASHSTSSFEKNVTEFTKAFKNSNGNSDQLTWVSI